MKKKVLALLCPLLVAGCAMPLPVQVASWAIDGISYLATRKSVAEHGLSIVTRKDCEVLRGVLGGGLCVDDVVSSTAVAAYQENMADSASLLVATLNAGKVAGFDDPFAPFDEDDATSDAAIADVSLLTVVVATYRDPGLSPIDAAPRAVAFVTADASVATFDGGSDAGGLGDFRTAAGTESEAMPDRSFIDPGGRASAFVTAQADVAELTEVAVETESDSDLASLTDFATGAGGDSAVEYAPEALSEDETAESIFEEPSIEIIEPEAYPSNEKVSSRSDAKSDRTEVVSATAWVPTKDGLYFVLGSFGYLDNARRAARVFTALDPNVVSAKVKDRNMYRVVVGPFSEADKDAGQRLLIDAGVFDSWSISLDGTTWTLVVYNEGSTDEVASRAILNDLVK